MNFRLPLQRHGREDGVVATNGRPCHDRAESNIGSKASLKPQIKTSQLVPNMRFQVQSGKSPDPIFARATASEADKVTHG
eukprot:6193978-Pleurochrysis_carterae.AAC.4